MSTVSLEEFLKPISQALGRTEPPASIEPCEATKAPLPGDYRDYSTEELAQWFTEEATKMGTIVREAKPEEVSQVVLDLVNEIGQGGHIVYSDVPEIDGFGIPEVLNNASYEAVRWNPPVEKRAWGALRVPILASPLLPQASQKPPPSCSVARKSLDGQYAFCLSATLPCCARAPSSLI